MRLRRCKVLEKMRAGGAAACYKVNFDGARAVGVVAMSGFDCVWTDMEHTPNSLDLVERQVLCAKSYGIDIIVRVKRGAYSDLIHPLEMDASGIMVPHVMSAKDAREVVRMTKFSPLGRRAADGGNADGAFCLADFKEYMRFANENRMVIIQIEDPEPMEELDEICAIEGVDMVFFGPGDYSCGIGVPGEIRHPEVDKARIRVAEAARKSGKLSGTTGSPETFHEYCRMGYNFVNIGSDVRGIAVQCRKLLDDLKLK